MAYKPIASRNFSAALPPRKAAVNPYSPIAGTRAPLLPPRPPVAPPATATGKPPQMSAEEWARQQAQRYIDSLVQGVNDQRQAYLDELQRNSQLEAARGQALAQALQALNIPGAVQAIYGNAGNDIAGYAQGFAGNIRDAALQDTANQQRMLSGTGQEGAVANNGVSMGDVFYGQQGFIPAKSMGEQGAAFAAQAALEPGFAMRIGQDKAGDVWAQGQAGLVDFAKAIADAKGQAPQMEQDLLQQRLKTLSDERDYKLAVQKAKLSQINDDRNYWLKMQAYYQATGKLKLAQDASKRANAAETRYRNESMGLDAEGNVAPDYMRLPNGQIVKRSEYRQSQKNKGLDVNGNLLPGFKRNAAGVVVPRYKPAAPKTPKTAADMTPGQKAAVVKTVLGKEKDITKTDLPSLAKQTGYDALLKNPKAPAKEKARLQKSISRALWVRYAPLAPTPQAKRVLRNMIARLVKGYKPGGGSSLTAGLLG